MVVSHLLSKALVALLFLVVPLHAFTLESDVNEELQKTCGTHMKEVDRYARKVLNGTPAHSGESPWSVAVYIPDHKGDTVYTTGTLVSRYHIISYDRIFLSNHTDGVKYRHNLEALNFANANCNGNDMILPKHLTRQVVVFLDMLKADRFSGRKELQVESITILNGCVKPYEFNRVAVMTLKKPVEDSQKAKPICVGSDLRPNTPFTFYGYGDNRGEVMDATLRHTEIVEVPCAYPSEDLFCVKASEPLCNGDFGGAAVKKLGGSIRAFGIYVDGPYECNKANMDTVYVFANMTRIADKICEATGVCASYLPKPTVTLDPLEGVTTVEPPPLVSDSITEEPGFGTTGSTESGAGATDLTDATFEPGFGTTDGPDDGGASGVSVGVTGAPIGGTDATVSPANCVPVLDDDDIHIHIRLGKYLRTGDKRDISVIKQGPKNGKRYI